MLDANRNNKKIINLRPYGDFERKYIVGYYNPFDDEIERLLKGGYIGDWKMTTYYHPMPNQKKYFNGSYEKDMYINCQGSCDTTASGYKLKKEDAGKIIACPPEFKLGTKFYIDNVGEVTCEDRGGAIKGKRMDIWQGFGDDAFVGKGSGLQKIYLIK